MNDDLTQFLMKGPRYGSYLDEKAFFDWLEAIKGVVSVKGGADGLTVSVDTKIFDNEALRNLISLYHRYNMDFDEIEMFTENSPTNLDPSKQPYHENKYPPRS